MQNDLLTIAKEYLKQGISVVPAHLDSKHPIVNWTEFQKRLPTEKELDEWFLEPKYNIGFITGSISNLFCIDIENDVDLKTFSDHMPLPDTAIARTGSNGRHYYYRLPKNVTVPTAARIFGKESAWKVDLRGEGGFVVAPPSIHPVTKWPYIWLNELDKISDCPEWIIEWVNTHNSLKPIESTKAWEEAIDGADHGTRNVSMTSFAGLMMKKLPIAVWDTAIPPAMQKQNSKNKPPLSDRELSTIYHSIKKKELARRQADGEIEEEIETSPQQEEALKEPISLKELYEKPFPENQWIIKDLIPLNSICVLSSPPGYFKTWVLLEMATKVSQGKNVFGFFESGAEHCGVLIVNEENWEGLVQARLKNLLASSDVTENSVYFFNQTNIKLTSKETDFLVNICLSKNIKLIIFDSLIRIHNFDENDASRVKNVFEQLKKFPLNGISVLFTHHHRKQGIFKPSNPSEQMRGSTDIAAMVDTHLLIDKKKITDSENEDQIMLVISQPKQRVKENLPDFKVKIVKEGENIKFIYDGAYDPENEKSAKINEFLPIVGEHISHNEGCDRKDIEKLLAGKIGTRYISEILARMEKDLVIYSNGRPKKYFITRESTLVFDQSGE